MRFFILLFIVFLLQVSCAHEGHHHGSHSQEAKEAINAPDLKKAYDEIQAQYSAVVKPLFDQKCAACHSSLIPAPWYAKIPVIGKIVESDRSEAKQHLEISKGFPFAGHGTVEEDFTALEDDVSNNKMPPRLYSLMHPSHRLSEDDKRTILSWIHKSQKAIGPPSAH